jgi:hypothetical protein
MSERPKRICLEFGTLVFICYLVLGDWSFLNAHYGDKD